MRLGSALVAATIVATVAIASEARTVCRTITVPVPYGGTPSNPYGGVTNVPQTVCEEVPDPPPPQAEPPQDPAQRIRALREVCELAKAAHGEEVGQKLCQDLIRSDAECSGLSSDADAYRTCMRAVQSRQTTK